MIYEICRVSAERRSFNGNNWLCKKPCSKAFSNTEVLMLSELDFAIDDECPNDSELEELKKHYSDEKEPYSTDWRVTIDDICEMGYLIREVGPIILYSNSIKIYDGYIE